MSGQAELLRMLASAAEEQAKQTEAKRPAQTRAMQARVLIDLLPEVLAANPFKIGDLVEQKPTYSLYKWPAEGAIAIVSATDVVSRKDRGNRFEREDIVVLCNVEDEWLEFAVESWRFQKYDGPIE